MGCFSIWKSRRASGDRPLLPPSQPICLIYENKPTALPDPAQVETELNGPLRLSAPPSFNDMHHIPPCTAASPIVCGAKSRAESPTPRFANAKNEPSCGGRSKLQAESSALATLYSRIALPVFKRRQRSVCGSSNSRPLVRSYSHSGPIFASASAADCHSRRHTFRACPQPLAPTARPFGKSVPLPLPHDPWLQPQQLRQVVSVRSLASSPCCSTAESFRRDFNGLLKENEGINPEPLPTPEEVIKKRQLRSFAWEVLAARCLGFSVECLVGETGSGAIYKTSIEESGGGGGSGSAKQEVTVFHGEWSVEDEGEFFAHITSLAEAHNSHLCTLVGYCTGNNSSPNDVKFPAKNRLLLFERLGNGTLDRHLHGLDDRPPLDWSTRMTIALDAATGLMELQLKFPDKAMYLDFRPLYIELDHNFRGKLTGYGSTKSFISEDLAKKLPMISKYLSPETAGKGELSVQSTVWSFGVVLLDLLTGGQIRDGTFPAEEGDLATWGKRVLQDGAKLFQILDPQLRGRYSTTHVKIVGNLILQCLQKDPLCRPDICYVVEVLRSLNLWMPTPECSTKHVSVATVTDSVKKCISLKQALHQRSADQNDLSSFPFVRRTTAGMTVKMQGQLQGDTKNSLSELLASSRSLSCSSSFASERKQSSTFYKTQIQQTG